MKKKGVSALIVTVLLIMITIAAVSIIYAVVIPMVKDWLNKGKSCFDLRDQVLIETNEYTCYNSTNTRIMITRASKEVEINGLVILLNGTRYEIHDNKRTTGVTMFNGSTKLSIPKRGEGRTYIFSLPAGSVELAPISSKDEVCEAIYEKIDAC